MLTMMHWGLLVGILCLAPWRLIGAGPEVISQLEYRKATASLRCESVAAAADGSMWLLVSTQSTGPDGKNVGPEEKELWRLNPDSKRVLEVPVANLTQRDRPRDKISEVFGIAAESDGALALLGRSAGGRLTLILVGQSGEALVRKTLDKGDRNLYLTRLLVAPDGLLTAVGRLDTQGFVLSDAAGRRGPVGVHRA